MLQENSASDLLGRAVNDASESRLEPSPEKCSELPVIGNFFSAAIRLWMPRAVPSWLESSVEPMQPDLKHFTSAKKVYEVEQMSAVVRLVLGTNEMREACLQSLPCTCLARSSICFA